MPLPEDLYVVRHGESIGNLAKRKMEGGDDSLLKRLRGTHTAHWKLTVRGVEQAKKTGEFLNRHMELEQFSFDRMYVSAYARAMMTAGHLKLHGAEWKIETRITERDWGEFDRYTDEERREKFADKLKMREVEPFFWAPSEGEAFRELYDRIHSFVSSLARIEAPRVIVVCHGEVMKAFRMIFAQMQPWEYKEMEFSRDPAQRIHNCQVDHYSRRNPDTKKLSDRLEWLEVYRPSEDTGDTPMVWRRFPRRRFANENLLDQARILSQDFEDLDL